MKDTGVLWGEFKPIQDTASLRHFVEQNPSHDYFLRVIDDKYLNTKSASLSPQRTNMFAVNVRDLLKENIAIEKLSQHDALSLVGYPADNLLTIEKEGSRYTGVLFDLDPSKFQHLTPTWNNVLRVLQKSPENMNSLRAEFGPLLPYHIEEVQTKPINQLSAEGFLLRQRMGDMIGINQSFTGDGWTRTIDGNRGLPESILVPYGTSLSSREWSLHDFNELPSSRVRLTR